MTKLLNLHRLFQRNIGNIKYYDTNKLPFYHVDTKDYCKKIHGNPSNSYSMIIIETLRQSFCPVFPYQLSTEKTLTYGISINYIIKS